MQMSGKEHVKEKLLGKDFCLSGCPHIVIHQVRVLLSNSVGITGI